MDGRIFIGEAKLTFPVPIKRLGIFCLPGRGHLYPATALGRRLRDRGFEVTIFNRNIVRSIVSASGLVFQPLEDDHLPLGNRPSSKSGENLGPDTLEVLYGHSLLVLRHGSAAVVKAGIQALLVDQADLAAGTIADLLHLPFVTLSFLPPVYLDDESPPFIFGWKPGVEGFTRRRNNRGNEFLRKLIAPVLQLVNESRKAWALPRKEDLNDLFSDRAIITQMPQIFDFPRRSAPGTLFYTGLFNDGQGRPKINFPWNRLNGKALVYASMGTVRNGMRRTFEIIAAASERFDVQLVISLGGMSLTPEEFTNLPGNPIVIHYCPQCEVLERAVLAITHGGVNTTLESISLGVPLIAIPVCDDQPGIAARIEWNGLGVALPFRSLSVSRLRESIHEVLTKSEYRLAVSKMQAEFRKIRGLDQAVEIVERVLSADRPKGDVHGSHNI